MISNDVGLAVRKRQTSGPEQPTTTGPVPLEAHRHSHGLRRGGRRALTTKPDHNRVRQDPIPTDALIAALPGERPHPTACTYFASRGSGVRVPLAPPVRCLETSFTGVS